VSVALVTGAGGAIGAAVTARLVADGLSVAVNDVDAAAARRTAEQAGGTAFPFDVADWDGAAAAVGSIERELGPIDVLVANHAHMTMAAAIEQRAEDWRKTLDVNLLGTAGLVELLGPRMRARGFGRIVAVASEWGVIGWANATAYAASMGGLISLVKSAARVLGPHGVAVNAVAPGVVDTAQLEVDARDAGVGREEIVRRYGAGIPLGRVGEPAEIAAVVAFLCGPEAIALVGQVLQPNGGTTRAGV
jgi:2-hydroxycyclohexanecarboxyl-CoA dehydrogenase